MKGRRRRGRSGRGAPLRWRRLRRWSLLAVCISLLAVSMVGAVRRSAEARALSRELEAVQRAELVARETLAEQARRADSLSSRPHIDGAARRLGLRPARDHEITDLADGAVVP